ncbi:MAG: glycosyltransferase family 2 protein [Oscillospiraceae bacterium]|nr:glycosyltransferase family 2 protein [Oscillospiraceae bacterium]
MGNSISCIIGAYNEEEMISDAVEECVNVLSEDFNEYEIILVDDGSADRTGEIMDALAISNPNIKVIHNLINLNFGASVLRGLVEAKNELVTYNAADLPLNPSLLKSLTECMGEADVLVIERMNYDCTFWRKLTSMMNRLLLFILFPFATRGTPILNFTQIFKREILNKIMPLARSPIFVWPELVFRAKFAGLEVRNEKAPTRIKNNVRKGAFGKPHDIIWGITDMLRFRFRVWIKKY